MGTEETEALTRTASADVAEMKAIGFAAAGAQFL